jgi:hypothetical protein
MGRRLHRSGKRYVLTSGLPVTRQLLGHDAEQVGRFPLFRSPARVSSDCYAMPTPASSIHCHPGSSIVLREGLQWDWVSMKTPTLVRDVNRQYARIYKLDADPERPDGMPAAKDKLLVAETACWGFKALQPTLRSGLQ